MSLKIETDLDGWSVVLPAAKMNIPMAGILIVHLLMGSAIGSMGVFMLRFGASWDVIGIVAMMFALGGGLFVCNAVYQFVQGARSTLLQVSGHDLRVQPRLLGISIGARRRIPLSELDPLEDVFVRPGFLQLSPTLKVRAAIPGEQRDTLIEVLDDCIAQAQNNPNQIPAPPAALQKLLAQQSTAKDPASG